MADSEAPRIKLLGPAKAPPPIISLRWLFDARAIPFEAGRGTPAAPPLIGRRSRGPFPDRLVVKLEMKS